jgi:fatty-acyl-CoA synthase
MRPDGYLVFLGRYKDMLKVGGENVAPAEVESHLCALPPVLGAAVVGVPDMRLGEVAAAFVILRDNAELTLDEVNGALRGQIASYKVPRYLFKIDEFPLTPTGKIMKPQLQSRALAMIADAGKKDASHA